jgi:hypothetical protein
MNIICFLTLQPIQQFIDFCATLKNENYSIYVCIDDNNYNIPRQPNITIIKINNAECYNVGFKNLVIQCNDTACSKDKAIYYFYKNNINYKYIWFIEEDVFIPCIDTIKNIDNKYDSADLLINLCNPIHTSTWGGGPLLKMQFNNLKKKQKHVLMYFKLFHCNTMAHTMTCAIRISKRMMYNIFNFIKVYNTMFVDEIFFYHIAKLNNLKVMHPNELTSIIYKQIIKLENIKKTHLYHPIKDINIQSKYRKILNA